MLIFFIYWLGSIGSKLIKISSVAYFQRRLADVKTDLVKIAFISWPFYTYDEKYMEKKYAHIKQSFMVSK